MFPELKSFAVNIVVIVIGLAILVVGVRDLLNKKKELNKMKEFTDLEQGKTEEQTKDAENMAFYCVGAILLFLASCLFASIIEAI